MEQIVFEGVVREKAGKGPARQARAGGFVPGILYGGAGDAVLVQVDQKSASHIIRRLESRNILADLVLKKGKKKETVKTLVKEIQIDPLTDAVLHIDFCRLRMDKPVAMQVPVHLVGESAGVKEGGILDHGLREVRVEALPKDIPAHIEVSIADLKIGDALLAKAVVLPAGVRMLEEEDRVIAAVLAPQKVEEPVAAPAEGEEGAPVVAVPVAEEVQTEPEVITKEKAEERRKAKEESKQEEK